MDNHYHVLAKRFGESHNGQPKNYLPPCINTSYALLKTNSDEKEVVGSRLKNWTMLSITMVSCSQLLETSNKQPTKFSICFSVQKCDNAVQVKCGLSQATVECLETVILRPYGGGLLNIADSFQTAHGSVNLAPVLTFSRIKNRKLNYFKRLTKRSKSVSVM